MFAFFLLFFLGGGTGSPVSQSALLLFGILKELTFKKHEKLIHGFKEEEIQMAHTQMKRWSASQSNQKHTT